MVGFDPNGYFELTDSLSSAMSSANPRPVAVAGEAALAPQRQSVREHVPACSRGGFTQELQRETLLAEFSPRELDVLQLLAQGLNTATMAQRLGIAPHTVEWHLEHVIEKLHIRSNVQAVVEAASKGLIQL